MNIKVILIAAVVIILMVSFGNNPVEEGRKEREEARKKYGDDPLVQSIKEHNEKNTGGLRNMYSPMPGGTGSSPLNTYSQPTTQQMYQGQGTLPQDAPAQAIPVPPTSSGYYPPPPATNATSTMRGTSRKMRGGGGPRSSNEQILPNGKTAFFDGARVFTADAKGNPVPLADGVYPIRAGSDIMVVRGGKRVISSN